MPQSTLALKATVTRKPAAVPSDMAERLAQLQHHQGAEAARAIDEVAHLVSADPATSEPKPPKRYDPHALQSAFLAAHLGRPVTVFLINGIRQTGKLRQFDQYCILLEGVDGINSMIFKHACASIVPNGR